MKRLLRGVIDFEDGKLSADALESNYHRLDAAKVEWPNPEDERIYGYVREFYLQNSELPTAVTLQDFFTREDNVEVLERIKDIAAAPVHARKQYSHLLGQLLEDQRRVRMNLLLKDTAEIVSKGRVVQEGREKVKLQGVKDGYAYLMDRLPTVLPERVGPRTKGQLDPEEEWARYLEAKRTKKVGTLSGFDTIDRACGGIKRGELWVHAGFSGDYKSTFATQWSYNAAFRAKSNVVYVSMEMPLDQIQRRICALHTSHPRFRGRAPLSVTKIRDGELSAEEETFYREALTDMASGPTYARLDLWQASAPTVPAIQAELQRLHREMDIDLVVVDHTELLGRPQSREAYQVVLNDNIRALKQLALSFNDGEGLPILLLHQINREGRKAAERQDGKYGLYNLSYAHEAERSADVVTTCYSDEKLRAEHTIVVANLKNRDNPIFPEVRLTVDPTCMRLYEQPSPGSREEAREEALRDVTMALDGFL